MTEKIVLGEKGFGKPDLKKNGFVENLRFGNKWFGKALFAEKQFRNPWFPWVPWNFMDSMEFHGIS